MLRLFLLWHHLEVVTAGVKVLVSVERWAQTVMEFERRRRATIFAALAGVWLAFAPPYASAQHACDAVAEEGWRVMPTVEIAGVKDSAPYRSGGDWVLDRTTTRLPFCNYITPTGGYSLRSYSLEPVNVTERVVICRGADAVAPYPGPCPPK
jgi:hypothetical protein